MKRLAIGFLLGAVIAFATSRRGRVAAIVREGVAKGAETARRAGVASGGASRRPHKLEDLTRDELYQRAQEADIPGRSTMSKEELIRALRQPHGR